MHPADRVVRSFEGRLLGVSFLGELSWLLAVGLFGLGSLVLVARLGWDLSSKDAALIFLPLAFLPVLAFWRARGRQPRGLAAAAWLDSHAGGQGVLVTGFEAPDERWAARVAQVVAGLPDFPSARLGGPLARTAVAALFALGVTWVHVPRPSPAPARSLFEASIARLGERLARLSALGLDQALGSDMGARLERLGEQIDAERAESTYEALDRLGAELDGAGLELGGALERMGLDLAETAAGLELDPETLRERVFDALRAIEGTPLAEKLPPELQALLKLAPVVEALDLDSAQLLSMSEGLRELFAQRLGELAGAGFLDPGRVEEAARRFFADGRAAGLGGRPGGDLWGEETAQQLAAFETSALRSRALPDQEHSAPLTEGRSVPDVEPLQESAGLFEAEASGGMRVWRRCLAPRHRRVVREFFGAGALPLDDDVRPVTTPGKEPK